MPFDINASEGESHSDVVPKAMGNGTEMLEHREELSEASGTSHFETF